MIDLNKHIELLLLDNDCVILPDLGGFVVHDESAKFDEDTGNWYPPYRSVGFNSQLNVNDGIMVQSIMQVYDTDYLGAYRLLEESVKHVLKVLQDARQWEFGSVGTLFLNSNGLYEFVPSFNGGIASPSLYGLDSLDIGFMASVADVYEEITLPAVEPDGQEIGLFDPSEMSEEQYAERSLTIWQRYGKSFIKYAAVFAGVIVLFFATSLPVSDVRMANVDISQGAVYSFPVKTALQNVRNSIDKISAIKQAEPVYADYKDVLDEENASTEVVSITKAQPYYTIVLASKVKLSNAEYFVDYLSKKGFSEGEIMVKGKMRRVVYSSYTTESDAYNALRSLRHQHRAFNEAWVMYVSN